MYKEEIITPPLSPEEYLKPLHWNHAEQKINEMINMDFNYIYTLTCSLLHNEVTVGALQQRRVRATAAKKFRRATEILLAIEAYKHAQKDETEKYGSPLEKKEE